MEIYTTDVALQQAISQYRFIDDNGYVRTIICEIRNNIITLNNHNICARDLYTMIKNNKNRITITIGQELIGRATTFTSACNDNQLCATVMFYLPGGKPHGALVMHRVGRLCGNVRGDLIRRLYTVQNVINDYKLYNLDQTRMLDEFMNGPDGQNSTDHFSGFRGSRMSNPIDRPALLMKRFGNGPVINRNDNSPRSAERYITRWVNNRDENVSKIFYYIKSNPNGITKLQLSDFITSLTRAVNAQLNEYYSNTARYGFMFDFTNERIKLTQATLDIWNRIGA